jgi:Sulfotransferase family
MVWNETEFLPNWIAEWNRWDQLNNREEFSKFYQWCGKFPYFATQRRKGTIISESKWFWGDKSPGYTWQIRTLINTFPNAKFVHLCRDVRDYALSVNKAWGKSLLRAAQAWKRSLRYVRQVTADQAAPIFNLKYEDLISQPDLEIQKVCQWLELPFENGMTQLNRVVESVGDAKGESRIVERNAGKYRIELRPQTIRQIEALAGRELANWGYRPEFSEGDNDLPWLWDRVLGLHDSANSAWSSMKRRGWWEGLKYAVLFRRMKAGRLEK